MSNYLDINRFKKSSAGTSIGSPESELEIIENYTWVGWFMITWFGTSQNPIYLGFKCKKTGELFEELTRKDDIKYFMLYRPR